MVTCPQGQQKGCDQTNFREKEEMNVREILLPLKHENIFST